MRPNSSLAWDKRLMMREAYDHLDLINLVKRHNLHESLPCLPHMIMFISTSTTGSLAISRNEALFICLAILVKI